MGRQDTVALFAAERTSLDDVAISIMTKRLEWHLQDIEGLVYIFRDNGYFSFRLSIGSAVSYEGMNQRDYPVMPLPAGVDVLLANPKVQGFIVESPAVREHLGRTGHFRDEHFPRYIRGDRSYHVF